jgi:WD40 repeat protein
MCGGWDKAVRVWDLASGEQRPAILNAAPRFLRALAFSPRGDLIATGGSGPARLWDTKTGNEVPGSFPEDLNPVFLPAGDALVGWTYSRGRVTICEVPSGQVRASWKAHPDVIEGLAVSPDGRFLASVGQEGVARIWCTADQTEAATLVGHRGSIYAAAFSPDGSHLATAGKDDGTVRLWDLPTVCRVRKSRTVAARLSPCAERKGVLARSERRRSLFLNSRETLSGKRRCAKKLGKGGGDVTTTPSKPFVGALWVTKPTR